MVAERVLMTPDDLRRAIVRIAHEILEAHKGTRDLVLLGMRTRGVPLAHRLADSIEQIEGEAVPVGALDIGLYRDDLSEIGPKPMVRPTRIDADINGKPLLLIDDVLFTGRSVRAGLDALSDFGRPSMIRLAVLVDRGGRELPIQADFVGLTLKDVPPDHRVNVRLSEVDGRDEIVVEPNK